MKKEVIAVTRQPRLILTLIVAPFVILLLFGLGYRTDPPPFETLLVLPSEQSALAAEREDLSGSFGEAIDLEGTITNATEARSRLRSGDVDLLIIGPADALNSLDEGEHAEFVIVHSEVDPVIRGSIDLLAQVSVDELNRRILENVVATAQAESEQIDEPLTALHSSSEGLVDALEEGDRERARLTRDEMRDQLDDISEGTDSSNSLYASVAEALGTERQSVFDVLEEQLARADNLEDAREFESQLAEFEGQLTQIQDLDPSLVVSPFSATVQDIADLPGTPALFYAPATLAVLVQHLAVTFAGLSVVRERQLGLTELFRASPLGTTETLIGKYLAFLALATSLSAVFTGLMFAFGVTMRGSFWYFTLTVVLVIMGSLGLGFMMAGVAQTDGQAVQYAMMLLLFSIFFTGLILPLEQLIPPVRAVSYLVPGTYGISALHDVMFRGLNPAPAVIYGLAAYGVLTAIGSWFVVRRDVGIDASR